MHGMILYCVRHEKAFTTPKEGFKAGWTCRFRNWAADKSAAAAAALAGLTIEALYASPLRRAMETAEIIAEALSLPVQTDVRLMEIDVGVFQDKRPSELAELWPQALAGWKSEDLDFVIPGGESRRQVIARGRAALQAIAAAGRQAAIVVSHGRLLTCTLKEHFGHPGEPAAVLLAKRFDHHAFRRWKRPLRASRPGSGRSFARAGSLRPGRFVGD